MTSAQATEREIAEASRNRVDQQISARIGAAAARTVRPVRNMSGTAGGSVDQQIEQMVGQEANRTPDAPGATIDGDGVTNDQIRAAAEGRRQELTLKGIADDNRTDPRAPTLDAMDQRRNDPLQLEAGAKMGAERPKSMPLVVQEMDRNRSRGRGGRDPATRRVG